MAYKVLANKWRPQDFTQVVGQSATIAILQNSLLTKNLHHAYLFAGSRGLGKTTLARIFAKALVCEVGITPQPCNKCELCQAVTAGNCLDVIEIDAASKTKVEDTRAVLENLAYAPNLARFKIYIIDEVHMLSNHSFNALLKSLEEPPEHVKFLLATTDPQKLPITVRSRSLQLQLKLFSKLELVTQLEKILCQEGQDFESAALFTIATIANGSMRDALSLLEQVLAFGGFQQKTFNTDVCKILGMPTPALSLELLAAIIYADLKKVLEILRELYLNNCEPMLILQELQIILKNITLVQLDPKIAVEEYLSEGPTSIFELAKVATLEEIQLYYEFVLHGFKNLPYVPDLNVGLEMLMLRMLAFRPINVSPAVKLTPQAIRVENSGLSALAIKDPVGKQELPTESVGSAKSAEPSKILDFKEQEAGSGFPDLSAVIEKLPITGLTKELAKHGVFKFLQADLITMLIKQDQQLLITEARVKRLAAAFSTEFAREIKIIPKIVPNDDPDLAKHTVYGKQQAKIDQILATDPNLNNLLENFSGEIAKIAQLPEQGADLEEAAK